MDTLHGQQPQVRGGYRLKTVILTDAPCPATDTNQGELPQPGQAGGICPGTLPKSRSSGQPGPQKTGTAGASTATPMRQPLPPARAQPPGPSPSPAAVWQLYLLAVLADFPLLAFVASGSLKANMGSLPPRPPDTPSLATLK